MAVLLCGESRMPRSLRALPVVDDVDAAEPRRLVVVGSDADLAAVLTRLLRADRLDVEVAFVPPRRSAATRAYRLPAGWRAARRARRGVARRVPLIRDETGSVIVGSAEWRPAGDAPQLHGEAVVDDTVLFDGDVAAVRLEPTAAAPGLRARVAGRPWVTGRAAQLGTTGAAVIRDGVAAARPVRRSTFYRHIKGWLLVR
ncbi:peptidase M50 [Mycobacterium celatum]|uniref:Peptidase M50 n=2 Tax=Mycobacterium celatum TaxID=28045 RepID=A0A2G5PPI3_MYCCE|nr:peptidase M50 [Mycobacterium celatum]